MGNRWGLGISVALEIKTNPIVSHDSIHRLEILVNVGLARANLRPVPPLASEVECWIGASQ